MGEREADTLINEEAWGAMGNIVGTLVTTFTTVINLVSVFVAYQPSHCTNIIPRFIVISVHFAMIYKIINQIAILRSLTRYHISRNCFEILF